MVANLSAAVLLNALTFLIHAAGLIGLTRALAFFTGRPFSRNRRWAKAASMAFSASGLFILVALEIGVWAAVLLSLEAFEDFETAYYVSTSAFATIGFGDVQPAEDWRLLAALEGVTGFIIVGWSAAYLVASAIRFGPFERDMHF
jgi:hypothetical protein